MTFVKSILAGLLALIVALILLVLGIVVVSVLSIGPKNGEEIGFDPISMARSSSPLVWIIAVVVFSLGFYWEYRRVRSRQAR